MCRVSSNHRAKTLYPEDWLRALYVKNVPEARNYMNNLAVLNATSGAGYASVVYLIKLITSALQ
jgi:hypothetical protein